MSDFNQKWSDDLQARLIAESNDIGDDPGAIMAEAACCLKALSLPKEGLSRVVISELIYKNTGIHESGFPEEFDELLTLCREIEYAITEPSK